MIVQKCTCGMAPKADVENYIGAAHLPGCQALVANVSPSYSFELQFEPGSLNIKIGGGQDGRGLFVFNDDVLDICDPGDSSALYREVPIEKSEAIALRDFLLERFPSLVDGPAQPAQGYPPTLHPYLEFAQRDRLFDETAQRYRVAGNVKQMMGEAFEHGMKHCGVFGDRALSDAYVRLRAKIPGAFKTPHAPSAEQVWKTTEEALDKMGEDLAFLRGAVQRMLKPPAPEEPAAIEAALAAMPRAVRDLALEEAAQVVDQCNREGPYNAIGAAKHIRELIQAKACGTCGGVGRDARDEGGRCQDCGGRGLADGEPPGLHPRAELLRRRTEATMAMRKAKFGGHPAGCDGLRSGVCTCPAPPVRIIIDDSYEPDDPKARENVRAAFEVPGWLRRHAPGCATKVGGECDCEVYKP